MERAKTAELGLFVELDRKEISAERHKEHWERADKELEATIKERDQLRKREKKLKEKNQELREDREAAVEIAKLAEKERERVEIGVLRCLYDKS